MANTASRLSANGSLTISGSFDEVTRIVPNGLILYYDAGKSYSRGSGNVVFDLSSSNNQGIIAGRSTNSFGGATDPVYASANSGYFILNGNGGYITSSTLYTTPLEFTIGVWFRTATTTRASKLIGFGNSQYQNSFTGSTTFDTAYDRHLILGADNRVYFGIFPGQAVSINSSSTYTDNVWHYAVGTFSGSQSAMRLYVDGVLLTSNTQFNSAQGYSGYWKIGAGSLGGWPSTSPGANYFLGDIGPAEVYSRALTADEVLQNYNVDAVRFGRTATPYSVNKLTANTLFITDEFDEVTYNQNNIGPTKNLFQNSQDFNQQFAWLIANGTVTKNSALAPDNTQTASLFSAVAQFPIIYYSPPGGFSGYKLVEPGKFYTQSMFVKYVNQSRCTFVTESWPTGGFVIFDLLTGTLASGFGGSLTRATITPFSNGWWRISVTYLIPSRSNAVDPNEFFWNPQWRLGNYDATNYSGSQTLVWGAQLEEGNVATTYVATGFPKNILLFTDELTTPSAYYWQSQNITITKNATISPDGNYNGFLLSSTINGGSNTCFLQRQKFNLPVNTNYTYSVYLKQGTSPTTFLNFYNVSPFTELVATITWPVIYGNTPTVSYSGGATRLASTITDAGNGWWRFSLSMNNGSSSGLMWRLYVTTNSTTNVIGNNVYVWGPQLEFGLAPTALIRNTGNYTNNLPLSNTNMVMKTTNTGNTFIKNTYDEYSKMSPITEGLIFNIDPGYDASFNSANNTGTMYDTTQNRYRVDLNNNPAYTDDFGGILKFTSTFGNNAWGNTSIPSGIITTTSNYTMSAWVKCNPTMKGLAETSFYNLATSVIVSPQANTGYSHGSTGSILGNNFFGGYGLFWLARVNNNGVKELTFGLANRINTPSFQQAAPLQTVTLNDSAVYLNWTHIAGVFNSSGNFCGFYVNGVLVNSTTTSQLSIGSFNFTTSTLRMCWDGITGGNPTGRNFDGDIGPMCIWNRALANTEVQQIFNSQRSRFGV